MENSVNGSESGVLRSNSFVLVDQEEVNSITVSIIPEYGVCPAQGLLLCYWNNIIGPHPHFVWQIEGKPSFLDEQVKYLSTHTLTSSDDPGNSVSCKLLFLKDHDMVVHIFLFQGYLNAQSVTFALSLVVPFSMREWYLAIHGFFELRLSSMVRRLRVLQEKYRDEENSPAIQAFSAKVPDFLRSLTRLAKFGLPAEIEMNDTVFASGQDKHLDVEFMRRAIAGHLQSCGCSIVVGNSITEINMVIYTLALFLSTTERQCSLFLAENQNQFPFKYEPDVHLQGFLKESFNIEDNLLSIMASKKPTTLIDLSTLEVKQMHYYNEHEYMKHEVITKELQQLWLESVEPIPVLRFQKDIEQETLVHSLQKEHLDDNFPLQVIGKSLADITDEMYMLNPEGGVREAFLAHFSRLLDRQALALIKYVEELTHRGQFPEKVSSRRIKTDLELHPEGNFRILLAQAEKLKPGIYTMICGTPAMRTWEFS